MISEDWKCIVQVLDLKKKDKLNLKLIEASFRGSLFHTLKREKVVYPKCSDDERPGNTNSDCENSERLPVRVQFSTRIQINKP